MMVVYGFIGGLNILSNMTTTMDIDKLEQVILTTNEPLELHKAMLSVVKEKSRLIKQRNDSIGLVDESFLNGQIALLATLEKIADKRSGEVNNFFKDNNLKFKLKAKELLSEDMYVKIVKSIK